MKVENLTVNYELYMFCNFAWDNISLLHIPPNSEHKCFRLNCEAYTGLFEAVQDERKTSLQNQLKGDK